MNSSATTPRMFDFWPMAALLLIITVMRGLYLWLEPYPLFFDEAQYWTWSKNPDTGYFSKPPMIAWLIAGTTHLLGDNSFGIRVSSTILHFATALILYAIANHLWNDKRTAFWSAFTYILIPAVTASSFFISADAPLLFFWAMAMLCFLKALTSDHYDKWWIALGLIIGLGLLSKYTMGASWISIILFLFFGKDEKAQLKSHGLWLAVFGSIVMFLPNILWNISNDFISIRHTGENMTSGGIALSPDKMLEFVGAQFGVFGPVLMTVMLIALLKEGRHTADKSMRFLTWQILPLLAVGTLLSLISGAQAHWAAPIYLPGTLLTVHYLLQTGHATWLKTSQILHIVIFLLIAHGQYISNHLPWERNPLHRVTLWNSLATPVSKTLNAYPGVLLASDERKAIATLSYNLRDKTSGAPYPVKKWNPKGYVQDYYDMQTDMNRYIGTNVVLLTRQNELPELTLFSAQHQPVWQFQIHGTDFTLYYLQNFTGYPPYTPRPEPASIWDNVR